MNCESSGGVFQPKPTTVTTTPTVGPGPLSSDETLPPPKVGGVVWTFQLKTSVSFLHLRDGPPLRFRGSDDLFSHKNPYPN